MSEILINTTTAGIQQDPVAAPFAGSLYLVVWNDRSTRTIKGQVVDAKGEKFRGEFTVNDENATDPNIDRLLPAITTAGGAPVVAWVEKALNIPPPLPRVKLQRFNREGRKLGTEIPVSTTDVAADQRPALASMIDGGFVVTWADSRRDHRIRVLRFSPDGVKVPPEFGVNTTDGFHLRPIAVRLNDGNYVIAWQTDPSAIGGGGVSFQLFELTGTRVGGETSADLSGLDGGKAITFVDDEEARFVTAHVKNGVLSDLGVIRSFVEANVYTPGAFQPNGRPVRLPISSSTDRTINSSWPAIASLPGQRFLLAWVQKSSETFSTTPTVRARIFSASLAQPLGPELQVNTGTGVDRFSVCVATSFGDGEAAFIGWSESGGAPGNVDVRGRPFRIVNDTLIDAQPS